MTPGGARVCPECRAKVDWLTFVEDRMIVGEYRDGIHYEVDSWPIEGQGARYECPKCGACLFQNSRNADAFLGRKPRPGRNPGSPQRRTAKP